MGWFTTRRTTPLDDLLAALDTAAATGSGAAASHALAIRRDGTQAVDRLLAEAATHVRGCKAMLSTAVIAAAARYDLAANGADWTAMPAEQIRARQAPSLDELLERRRRREAAALARAQQRAKDRNLVQLRDATTERTTLR